MLELDILLVRYLERDYATATPAMRTAFRQLLKCEDNRLHAYLTGAMQPADPAQAQLVQRIRTGDA